MTDPFFGSSALVAGALTPYELRSRYVALHKDVYVPWDAELTVELRAKACWLRSRRRGILAGLSASALHGAKWIDPALPAAIIDTNRRRTPGVQIWEERIEADEIVVVDGMSVTTPARTALDLARRFPLNRAVEMVDALIQATELKMADAELLVDRYRGRRGMKAARAALELVDGGAQSPKETWLRLLLIRAGFPRPQTQIVVRNQWGWIDAALDMGALRNSQPENAARLRSREERMSETQLGSRRLISSAASAASARAIEPSRSQPTLASPLIVS